MAHPLKKRIRSVVHVDTPQLEQQVDAAQLEQVGIL